MRLDITNPEGQTEYDALVEKNGRHGAIYLDGVAQNCCVMADDQEGVIKRYEKDDLGRFIETEPGVMEIFERRGKVEILFAKETA